MLIKYSVAKYKTALEIVLNGGMASEESVPPFELKLASDEAVVNAVPDIVTEEA